MTYEELKLECEKFKIEKEEVVAKNEKLQKDLFNVQLALLNFTRHRFGMKKESFTASQQCENTQLSLFDTETSNEENAEIKENVEQITGRKKQGKKKEKSGLKKSVMKNVEHVEKEYTAEEGETCHICGNKLIHVGKNKSRSEIVYVPAHFRVIHHSSHTYKCRYCGTENNENAKSVFKTTRAPRPLFTNSFASPSLVTEVLYNKFLMGVPFYRQELVFDEQGLVLPRSMMANWAIKSSEYYLGLLVDLMLRKMKQECYIVHADETTIQCNKEKGKAATSKSYMWVMCSGEQEEHKCVVFNYASTRSAEYAQELLKGFNGCLCTDGYASYNNVDCAIHSACWSHVRRKFFESVPNLKDNPNILSEGQIGVKYCDKLFELERVEYSSDEEKLEARKTEYKKVFDEFYDWVEATSEKYTVNKKLKDALTYATNQKVKLGAFLKNSNIPLSNNRAERAIRPFAVHRKNWLFADSVAGAKANATIYSIIESAKINKLNVYKYMNYLLEELPQFDSLTDEVLEKFLPSSKTLPIEIQNCEEEYKELNIEQEK